MDKLTKQLVEAVNNIVASKPHIAGTDTEIRELLGFQGPGSASEGQLIQDFKKFVTDNRAAFYSGPKQPINIKAAAEAFKYRFSARPATSVPSFHNNTINSPPG